MPALDFDEMAERIIKAEGVAFAIAWQSAASDLTKKNAYVTARGTLKKAIVEALGKAAKSTARAK